MDITFRWIFQSLILLKSIKGCLILAKTTRVRGPTNPPPESPLHDHTLSTWSLSSGDSSAKACSSQTRATCASPSSQIHSPLQSFFFVSPQSLHCLLKLEKLKTSKHFPRPSATMGTQLKLPSLGIKINISLSRLGTNYCYSRVSCPSLFLIKVCLEILN